MYAIGAGSVASVLLRGVIYGQTVMTTFHYQLDNTGVVANGGAFLSDFNDELADTGNLYPLYKECVPAQVTGLEADLQWIYPDRFLKRTFVVGGGGNAVWVPTGTNQAMVLTLRADIADKRSIGDKHLPGLGGTVISSGLVQPNGIIAMSDLGTLLTTPVTVGTRTMTPIIFGRARPAYVDKHGNPHPALPVSRRPVTSFIPQLTARVMRRRTVGVGI